MYSTPSHVTLHVSPSPKYKSESDGMVEGVIMLTGEVNLLGGGICNLGFVFYNLLCGGLNEGWEIGIMGQIRKGQVAAAGKEVKIIVRKEFVGETFSREKV